MKICISCGQSIKDDSIFCPFCGAKNDVTTNAEYQEQDVLTVRDTAEAQEPEQNAYTAPVQAQEQVQNTYTAPVQAQAPEQNAYTVPVQPQQPVQNTYTAPIQSQQPVQPDNMQNSDPYIYNQIRYNSQPVQQPMQQPMQPSYYATASANMQAWKEQNDKPLSVGGWMLTLLIMSVPIANIIMLFVWGFGEGNTSRKNFCRAYLIYMLITVVLTVLFMVFLIGVGAAASSATQSYYYY